MDTKEVIIKEGLVKEALMAGMFKVELEDGVEVLASLKCVCITLSCYQVTRLNLSFPRMT